MAGPRSIEAFAGADINGRPVLSGRRPLSRRARTDGPPRRGRRVPGSGWLKQATSAAPLEPAGGAAAADPGRPRHHRQRGRASGSCTASPRARCRLLPDRGMAMSVFAFAGAAQFAAVGYVASGAPWPGIGPPDRAPQRPPPPLLRGAGAVVPGAAVRRAGRRRARPDRRGVRAVDRPLPAARPGRRVRLLVRRDRRHVHPVEPRDAGRRRCWAGRSPTRSDSGIDVIFPAAMIGLAVGLITGRRELVAAIAGAADRRRRVARCVDDRRDHRRRAHRPGGRPARAGGRRPARRRRSAATRRPSATRCRAHTSTVEEPAGRAEPTRTEPMSTDSSSLAVIMFAFTYPSRAVGLLAPAIDGCRGAAFEYLQLVGPAVLAALAASRHGRASTTAGRSFTSGCRGWRSASASLLVAWRRNLFLGLVAAVADRRHRPGRRPRLSPAGERRGSAAARLGLDLDEERRLDQRRRPGRSSRPAGSRRTARRGRPRPPARRRSRRRTSASGRRRPSANPPSASARSTIAHAARAWAGRVAGMQRAAVRARRRSSRDPAARRRRRPPGCSRPTPPTGRRTRSAAGRSRAPPAAQPQRRPGRGRSPAAARRGASSAARSRRPRGTRPASGRCRRSGPSPSSVGHAHARRRVRVRGAAGRGVVRARTRAGRRARPRGRRAGPTARASPSATSGPSSLDLDGRVGHRQSRRASARIAASTVLELAAPVRPDVDLELAPLGDDVRPRAAGDHADVDGHARPAAVERVEVAGRGRAASRIALRPFSGSTPAWAARPWTVIRASSDALARRDDVAVRPGALEDEARVGVARPASAMWGVDDGEPISSSGLATNVEPLERQRRRARRRAPGRA